ESECGSDPLLLATSSGEKSVKRRHSDDEEEDSDHNNDNKISDGEEYDWQQLTHIWPEVVSGGHPED
ncbi:unnamed protein product, partial [Medioppia subpectinata]